MKKLITLSSAGFKFHPSDSEFEYQKDLTEKLDNITDDFDDDVINKIILWKLNRYALIPSECITKINTIDPLSQTLDVGLTREILGILLRVKGIRLPMASTILRFKNKNLYQIIDQRVYRIINDKNFPLSSVKSQAHIDKQIDMYLKYLQDLKAICMQNNIDFSSADRVLYMADKRVNKDHKIIGW